MSALRRLGLLFFGALIVAWCMGATPSFACGGNPYGSIYVDADSGNDGTGDGNAACPYQTLAKALSVASCGNTVLFIHGAPQGPVYLGCQIAIVGPADDTLEIVANPGAALWTSANNGNSSFFGCIGPTVGTCPVAGPGTSAVQIAANASTDSIKLKGLLVSMGSNSTVTTAVQIDSAFGVALTGVKLRGEGCSGSSSGLGLLYVDSSQSTQLQVYIHNSDVAFACNQGAAMIEPTGSGNVYVNFSGGEVHNASFGLTSNANSCTCTIFTAIDETQFFSFNTNAVTVIGQGTGIARAAIVRSSILNTGTAALQVNGANAGATLFEDVITGNADGVAVKNGGFAGSFGNNQIFGNGPGGTNNCESNSAPASCSSVLTPEALN